MEDIKDTIINQYKEQIDEQNKIIKDVLEIMSADNKSKVEERKRNSKDRLIQLAIILFFTTLIAITFIVSYFFGTYTTTYSANSSNTTKVSSIKNKKEVSICGNGFAVYGEEVKKNLNNLKDNFEGGNSSYGRR